MNKLYNGDGKRPIQDISFVGDDLYHCWWNGLSTVIHRNNKEIVIPLEGKHQGLSVPYIINRKQYNMSTGHWSDLQPKRATEENDYVTGCRKGDDIVLVSKSGYECMKDVKLQGTPNGLHLQGVEFNEFWIYTLWGNSSFFTNDWIVQRHDKKYGYLLGWMKAPLRPKVISWRDLFAKRYEPEGLSFDKNGVLHFGYCVKRWNGKYECYAVPVDRVFE